MCDLGTGSGAPQGPRVPADGGQLSMCQWKGRGRDDGAPLGKAGRPFPGSVSTPGFQRTSLAIRSLQSPGRAHAWQSHPNPRSPALCAASPASRRHPNPSPLHAAGLSVPVSGDGTVLSWALVQPLAGPRQNTPRHPERALPTSQNGLLSVIPERRSAGDTERGLVLSDLSHLG